MKRLSTKWFNKWSKKANLKNQDLLETIQNLKDGLSSTDMGNHLFKVRFKREHSGKSSGFRTIIVYKENISKTELQYFKKLANDFLGLNIEQLEHFVNKEILFDLEKMN